MVEKGEFGPGCLLGGHVHMSTLTRGISRGSQNSLQASDDLSPDCAFASYCAEFCCKDVTMPLMSMSGWLFDSFLRNIHYRIWVRNKALKIK